MLHIWTKLVTLRKFDKSILAVCGTTGKRKACKDCTCGLAEELSGKTPQEGTVKSSCGSVSYIFLS